VFTLARIAGHSSITITQRYVHPQADATERAFQQTTKGALLSASQRQESRHSEIYVGTMGKGPIQGRP
jgi:hypothetical protein